MLEFYGAAAGIIPVFLLTLVLQTRAISFFVATRMELEETRLLFVELGAGRVADREWLEDLGFRSPNDLRDANLLRRKERALSRTVRIIDLLAYGPIASAFVALATSLGALFAGGAPWPVSLLVWPGLVFPGLLLAVLWCSAIGQKMAVATVAARSRLEQRGIVMPISSSTSSGGNIDPADRLEKLVREDRDRRAFLRQETTKWITDEEDI
jgi:hypothetical protein